MSPEENHSLADRINATDSQVLMEMAAKYYSQIIQKHGAFKEYFCSPEGEKTEIEENNIRYIPLYRDDDSRKMLVLVNSKKGKSAIAVYLNESWWPVEDLLKTSDQSKEGLLQVQTFGERITLFVLNCLLCGFSEEDDLLDEAFFLPHASGELAKILWHKGEAAAFYTYKNKGSLCTQSFGECYQLPVLDTVFVQKRWRRHGMGTKILQDYSQIFSEESVLGISCPISPMMYKVCRKFLTCNLRDRDRFWEVEAPGHWNQRVNIWLKIKLSGVSTVEEPTTGRDSEQRDKATTTETDSHSIPDKRDCDQSIGNSDAYFSTMIHKKRRNSNDDVEDTTTKHIKKS
ncbi:hypothetical protein GDO86_006450 [Hymenochirus boettgeri]|uniref:Protein FAM169B n=1 Tax=Hymenochirus boettgeri TaxID=247094 RepID=A0A8T2JB39_9PIPI|nr:hypothetical protein GDO86_006450 [Hymenochirus boettgeri]